jgi:uncharacterized protein
MFTGLYEMIGGSIGIALGLGLLFVIWIVVARTRRKRPKTAESVQPKTDEQPAQPVADFPCSVETHTRDAEKGDSGAMLALAGIYAAGEGVPRDYTRAFEWCRKALEAGNNDALLPMATMYRRGRGVARDDKKALDMYERAADQGQTEAMVMLGWMYGRGIGTPRNPEMATRWLARVEKNGRPEDLTRLGDMYVEGDGVPQDYVKAMQLYRLAAESREIYMDLYGLPQAAKPDSLAMIGIGRMYAQGRGVPRDDSAAMSWYAKALHTKDPVAAQVLAGMYRSGDGVPKDEDRAAELEALANAGEE